MNVNDVRIEDVHSKKYDFVMRVIQGEDYVKEQTVSETKSTDKDSYVTSITSVEVVYEAQMIKGESISEALLDVINFESSAVSLGQNTITVCGITMLREQISNVGIERCSEIAAIDNEIVLKEGTYYKFADEQGEVHILACRNSMLSTPRSEQFKGIVDEKNNARASFWNLLCEGSPYIRLYYSQEEESQILNEAGITDGFFSVQVGSRKGEYYLANGRYVNGAIPKWQYDDDYEMYMTREGIFDEYEVGSVFIIDGEEYVLDENKKLNIPYGVDIFDITYPPKSETSK